jgi:archaellum component FlaG (FlaF/FlaG flagellin family)
MRKIVLSAVTMALIAASASQAFAAQSHHVRKAAQTTSEQLRNARNAVAQPSQPAWQYRGWSAPAGR